MGAQGTTVLDFGAFPGRSDASVTVTGQASIVSGSLVEAWIRPVDSADHTADEHLLETLKIVAGNIVAGTGFTIYGFNMNQINEPLDMAVSVRFVTAAAAQPGTARTQAMASSGGMGTRLWGQWNVAWVWN